MIFCRELDLPPPSDFLLVYALKVLQNQTDIKNMQVGPKVLQTPTGTIPQLYERYVEYQGKSYRSSNVERFPFDEIFLSWFEKFIYSNIRKCNLYQLSSQSIKNGSILHPHTDGPRGPYVLSYLIDTGGENVDTIWYKEKGKEILRQPATGLIHFEGLEELFRYRVRPFTWTLMDARVLHSVIGMTSNRYMISIGLYPNEYAEFLSQHNLEDCFYDIN